MSAIDTITGQWSRRRATVALLLLGVVVLTVGIATLNEGYIDFGDGNYLYISWRLSEGALLYRDILSPQPPLHLHLGAALIWLGDHLGNALLTVRFALVLIQLLTGWLIYRLARRWEFGRGTAVLGCVIWWLCPIGYRWGIGWQSENIEIPLMLASQLFLLRRDRVSLFISGLLGAGALLCNMTAAPYVLWTGLIALWLRRQWGLLYWAGLIGGWGCVALFFEKITGAFFANVIANQVVTYPKDYEGGLMAYFRDKLVSEGGNVLRVEGVFVALAIVGLIVGGWRARRRWLDPVTVHRGIFSLGGLLSITYVTKGGTVDYIFCIGEPFVGIWAAFALVELVNWKRAESTRRALLALAVVIFGAGVYQTMPVMRRYLNQSAYEWSEDRMAFVNSEILAHSGPDDLILAPPQFAFQTRRHLVEDLSSTYLWYTKWRIGDEEGLAMMDRVGEAIRRGDVAVIALNGLSPVVGDMIRRGGNVPPEPLHYLDRYIAQITPIRRALFETCALVGPRLQSQILRRLTPNEIAGQEDLTFWVPRGDDGQ